MFSKLKSSAQSSLAVPTWGGVHRHLTVRMSKTELLGILLISLFLSFYIIGWQLHSSRALAKNLDTSSLLVNPFANSVGSVFFYLPCHYLS